MSLARRFWTFARPYQSTYIAGLVLLLVTNGLALWVPWLLRDAVGAIESGAELKAIAGYAGAMCGAAVLAAVARTLSRLAILGNSRKIVCDIRSLFFAHLQRLGASFYDSHRTGDIMSRGVNDIQLIQSFFGPGAMNLLNTAIVYTATLTLLLRIDARLTVIALTVYPVLLLVVNRVSRLVYSRSLAVQEQLAAISNRAQENISGIQQVKTYVQEEREIGAFAELCSEFRRRNLSMAALRGGMLSLIGVVTGIGSLIVLFVGGKYVISGRIGFGDFVAFNAYLGMLVWPTIALGWIINTFQRGAGAMKRIDEILSQRPDVPPNTADEPDDSATVPVEGDIEIRGLTFDYATGPGDAVGGRVAALHEIDLTIPAGSRIALVGPVGSGKSTLANLLARLYPVPTGSVFIGGTDLHDVPTRQLRRSIGYVPQEAFLFSRSVRDNVTFNRPWVSEADLVRALEVAQLSGDLDKFPEGLDTVVGERGFTLSGGQRQRATLARALLGDPRILILDDPFASLDADTEQAVLGALDELMSGRTSILITHRLSTLASMDRIVVLEQGRVVEDGSHDELLDAGGAYARLFRQYELEQSLEDR